MSGIASLKTMATMAGIAGGLCLATLPAEARKLRYLGATVMVPAGGRTPTPYAYSFYPHEIEGGVSGNLPFNNQIRKFRDPLNANGAGG